MRSNGTEGIKKFLKFLKGKFFNRAFAFAEGRIFQEYVIAWMYIESMVIIKTWLK